MISNHRLIIEKNRFIYLLSNIAGHLYILVTIPLLTRYLSPDEFGFYTILLQVVVIIQTAGLVLFSSALQRFYIEYEESEKREFLGAVILLFVVILISISVVIYMCRYLLFPMIFPNITIPLDPYVKYVVVWICLSALRNLLITFIKVIEKPWLSFIQIIIYGSMLILFLFWKVVIHDGKLEGALESLILAELISLLILILSIKEYSALTWQFRFVKKIIIFSSPLAISTFLFILFSNIDRIILSRYVSIAEIGIYGIGFMVGNIASLIVTANVSSYAPRILKIIKLEGDEAAKAIGLHCMQESLALMSLSVAGLTVLNDVLVSYLGKNDITLNSSIVVVGIALGNLARSQFIFFQQSLFNKKKTGLILSLNIMLLMLGLIVGYFLVWLWGMKGISFMMFVSYVLIYPFAFILSNRYFNLPLPIRSIATASLFIVFLIGIEVYLDQIGRSFSSTQYWGCKLIEVGMVAALYGKYFIGLMHSFQRQRGNNT